ncbi:MAG: hypothetical protein IT373_21205 [Polyangiaceae bacterium]|nr:hypothetical protein [Polyangiaceae bacterium]
MQERSAQNDHVVDPHGGESAYFIATDGADEGPYPLDALRSSLQQGFLRADVRVRRQSDDPPVALRLVLSVEDERRDIATAVAVPGAAGNFNHGFALGFFFGVFALVWGVLAARPATKRGIWFGAALGISFGILSGLLLCRR